MNDHASLERVGGLELSGDDGTDYLKVWNVLQLLEGLISILRASMKAALEESSRQLLKKEEV